MTKQLAKGVNLHILPTDKYKTIRIFIRFTAPLSKEIITKRTLLSNLLETNSYNYPDQTKLSAKLAEMYGASFGLNVRKKGNLHWLDAGINFVNGEYVNDDKILGQAVDFMKEILFFPNVQDQTFDLQTFQLEKENLKAYFESVEEDKQAAASLALQELYFNDEGQQTPSFGTVKDLEALTPEMLAVYHQQVLLEDQVDIFVIGDIDPSQVETEILRLPFEDRRSAQPEIFYNQAADNIIKEKQVQEKVIQAKLNLGYQTGVYYDGSDRFPLLVFNGLFGGFPHSKLFMNVREKESLAYYASSSIDTFRGFMTVQTGIDGKNRNQVLRLVNEQLESLKNGEITELELAQTKAMLKNQHLLSLDAPQAAIESAYLDQWLPKQKMTDDQWLSQVEAVTVKDVQKIARDIRLQAVFFLDGGKNNE